MLSYDDALNLNYYKKTSFSGWMGGMRFLIKKEQDEAENNFFHAWVWPGPYIFAMVRDEEKQEAKFSFDEAGRKQAVDWINEQFETKKERWPKEKI